MQEWHGETMDVKKNLLTWIVPLVLFLFLLLTGLGIFTAVCIATAYVVLNWWLSRSKKPAGEMPNASVSCCHYLGEDQEE